MVNLPTKFEVSAVTRYGDMKGVKMHKMGVVRGHPRSPAMSPFDRPHTIKSSIESMSLSCTVFEILTLICPKFKTVT